MRAQRWSRAELNARLRTGSADLVVGVARECPVVVVDGPDGEESSAPMAELAAVTVRVGAAPGETTDDYDVVAADRAEADRVVDSVLANPTAATVLVQVLRAVDRRRPLDGLVTESLAYATLQAGPEFDRWLAGRGRRVRPPTSKPPVHAARDGAELVLTLDRPRLRNAYDAAMRDALVDALRVAVADPTIAEVRLRGAGSAFSIGGDLAEFGTERDPLRAHLIRSAANAAPWLLRIADRLVAEVHGTCVGSGVELAAFAGTVRAAPDTTFRLPEVSMGLIPGAGGTVSVTRRIGRQRAAAWMLTGETIDAGTARDWGLVDEIADPPGDG